MPPEVWADNKRLCAALVTEYCLPRRADCRDRKRRLDDMSLGATVTDLLDFELDSTVHMYDRQVEHPSGRDRPALSPRETEVLIRWLQCDSKAEVARSLYVSIGTVNTHLTRIRDKYALVGRRASTKAALAARAIQDGLVRIDEL